MRRSLFYAQPARLVQAFSGPQTRRAYATIPTKDTSPPSPVERSAEQAHPIGPFYQAILDSAKLPENKVETAPKSSNGPPDPPAEETPKPESTPAPRAEKTDFIASPTPPPRETPAKRGRKPKESNGKNKPEPGSSSGQA